MVWLILVGLVAITIIVHYEVLRFTSDWLMPRLRGGPRPRLVIAVIVGFCAHFIEILIFAMAMSIMVLYLGLGTIEGPFDYGFDDFVYFSAVNFSSLGYGDVIPGGALRLIAAFEALTGLLMITWTASFTYLQMEKLWSDNSHEPVTD